MKVVVLLLIVMVFAALAISISAQKSAKGTSTGSSKGAKTGTKGTGTKGTGTKGTGTKTGTKTGKATTTTGSTGFLLSNSKLAGNARSGIASPTFNNFELYAIGGTISDNTALADVDKYYLRNNTWRSVQPLNTARNAPGAAGIDGQLFTFGGIDNNLVPLTSTEIYNDETNTWSFGPSLNAGRWNLGAVQRCTEIYAIGGYDFTGSGNSSFISAVDTVEVYSTTTGVWSFTTSLPQTRAAFGAVLLNNEIWVIGGTSQFLTGTAQAPLISSDIFNVETATWRSGPDLNQPRVGFGAAVIDNKIFIAGGRTLNGPLISQIEYYDPLSPELGFQVASFTPRTLRFNNAVGVIANTLFLIGGRVTNANSFSFTDLVEPIQIFF